MIRQTVNFELIKVFTILNTKLISHKKPTHWNIIFGNICLIKNFTSEIYLLHVICCYNSIETPRILFLQCYYFNIVQLINVIISTL
jgi:hypothetical protein